MEENAAISENSNSHGLIGFAVDIFEKKFF